MAILNVSWGIRIGGIGDDNEFFHIGLEMLMINIIILFYDPTRI